MMRAIHTWPLAGAALLIGVAAGVAGAQPQEEPDWSYRHLDLEVTIDPAAGHLAVTGHAVVVLGGASASEFRLFVNTRAPAMLFERLATPGSASEVVFDLVEGRHVALVALADTMAPGDTVAVDFALRWEEPSFQLLLTDSVALASWVEAWYPVLVNPGRRPVWAVAGSTRFHLPPGWHAVTNGTLQSEGALAAGQGRVAVWHTPDPVNRSFAAGPYLAARTDAGGREIGVYLLTADTVSARLQAETLLRAIRAMEAVWGPYPYDGYAIAEIPDDAVSWAASSEQGFIMATSRQFGDDGNLPLFAHEAAHGWWGNQVQSHGTASLMVSEALAQYGAVVAIEALEGEAAMNDFLRFSRPGYNQYQSAHGYFEIIRRGGDKPLSQLTNDRWDHNLSDAKGHWFYHMLRHRVGSDHFFSILRQLQEDRAGSALSLPELRQTFIDAVPEDEGLAEFMAQWLDRTGAPHLETRWWTTDAGRAVHLELTQAQPDLYDLEITVELELIGAERVRHQVRLVERTQAFALDAPARIVGLHVDPDHRLLFWRPEYGPPVVEAPPPP
jgi:hypothetical protein